MSCARELRAATPTIRVSTRRVQFSLAVNDAAAPIGDTVASLRDAAHIARAVIGGEISECVLAIFLDARHRVSGYAEVSRGTLNAARLQARDIFVPALLANSASVIAAHCHPSGDARPSRADRSVTAVLREAGTLIGVQLIDHIIVTATDHYSFREDERWDDARGTGAPQ